MSECEHTVGGFTPSPYDSRERSVPCPWWRCQAEVGEPCHGIDINFPWSHSDRVLAGLPARKAAQAAADAAAS